MPVRHTRYQGAIMRDGAVLLIQHRHHATGEAYWLLPGGGMEPGETAEQAVAREMLEETGLTVRVDRLLVDVAGEPGGYYERLHTYLCTPIGGEAAPGYEPEPDAAAAYGIVDVRWLPMADDAQWGSDIVEDRLTLRALRLLQQALRPE
jgi:8-oxo-dGTP pyrophosphatase MutT (NUDIX family)